MPNPGQTIPRTELSDRLQSLMLLRVIFVSLLLGASVFIQIRETQAYFAYIQNSHYILIAGIYFLTFIYVILFKNPENRYRLAYLQLLIDTFIITAIIYTTGGIESIFSFLYILTIINASIILYRKGGYLVASSSSILYGLLLDLHYYGILHPLGAKATYSPQYQDLPLFFMILVNIAAFYLVAYLTSYLSEQTRKSRVELKAKQKDLDKLEILNENIISSINSALLVIDENDRIILFNPAAEGIFGTSSVISMGKKFYEVLRFLDDSGNPTKNDLLKKIKNFSPFTDLSYEKPDEKLIHLQASVSPLRFPFGDRHGHIMIFQDVTELKRIQEEIKRVEGLALVGELAAGIAHEIRNPMASISGSIQMLRDDLEKNDVNARLMDIIIRETNRLNHLINDFLRFARPRKPTLTFFEINDIITESLELFKNSQQCMELIEIKTDFHEPLEIESDPEQIKQVLWNLFLNANEAMPDGGMLYVATGLKEDDPDHSGKRVKIVVRDTGKGFDKKALSQLFIPFFTTKEGGSGLGLATVKRIVEGLQGKVWGENHPHGGAEVTISIPLSITVS